MLNIADQCHDKSPFRASYIIHQKLQITNRGDELLLNLCVGVVIDTCEIDLISGEDELLPPA